MPTDSSPTTAEPVATMTEEPTRLDPALDIGNAPNAGKAVARVGSAATPAPASPGAPLGLLKPIAPIAEIIEQQNALRAFIKAALVKDRDYGEIPGIEKPSLLKPGAERINAAYGVIARFSIAEQEVDHDRENKFRKDKRIYENGTWTGRTETIEGVSFGLYRFVVLCELIHRETGIVVGSCIGSCSTLESKYIDRPRDVENTIIKMAEKRAYIGATVLAYGLSDEFTQDVEDNPAAFTGEPGAGNGGEAAGPPKLEAPICPIHKIPMRDFRRSKKNVKAPDWKCTQHEMQNGQKVWCDEKKWPGEWPPKSKANPQTPTEPTAASSAGSDAPQSSGSTTPSSSESSNTSPNAAIPIAGDVGTSSNASGPSGTEISSNSAGTNTITRGTAIDWATGKFGIIQGKRLQDLEYRQLEYFIRNEGAAPAAWMAAIRKELTLREDTGDDRDDGGGMQDGY